MPEVTGQESGLLVAGRTGIEYVDLRRPSNSRTLVGGVRRRARYLSSGHVNYNSGTSLMAVSVDPSASAPTGDSVELVEDLRTANYAVAQFTVSDDGTLVYVPGRSQGMTSFVWVDREGAQEALGLPDAVYEPYALSPDGTRLAYGLGGEIWIWDRARRTSFRPTPRTATGTAAQNRYPRWTPDGKTVVYESTEARSLPHLLAAAVDGSTSPNRSVASDGHRPVGHAVSDGVFGQISPDGHWMLFSSDQSGAYEVWVTSYPKAGPLFKLSDDGGREPTWNPAVPGEVVYASGRAMYAVSIARGPAHPGRPQLLFDGPYPDSNGFGLDMAPDGRFLMLENKEILKPTTTLAVVTRVNRRHLHARYFA